MQMVNTPVLSFSFYQEGNKQTPEEVNLTFNILEVFSVCTVIYVLYYVLSMS